MAARKQGSEKHVNLRPTMGKSADQHRLLLNVVSRDGVMERRPAIRAIHVGYSTETRTTITATTIVDNKAVTAGAYSSGQLLINGVNIGAVTVLANDSNSALRNAINAVTSQTNVVATLDGSNRLVLTATEPNYGQQITISGTDPNGDIGDSGPILGTLGAAQTQPSVGNGADISGYTKNFSVLESGGLNPVVEGIDVEIVAGKVMALYLYNAGTDSASNHKFQMAFSWHHPEDPLIGAAGGGSIISNSGVGKATSGTPTSNAASARYVAGQWWNRRIIKALDGFIITGKGVGYDVIAGAMGTNAIGSGDEVVHWDATPMRMFANPLVIDATQYDSSITDKIPRVDPFATIHCKHAPKNAFAHVDRRGQFIWYGFTPGQSYEMFADIPANNVLVKKPITDFEKNNRRTVVVQDYDVWFSEPNSPLSLPMQGLLPVANGSNASEVVGMAEYKNGTLAFTRDTVQFVGGIGLANSWEEGTLTRQIVSHGIGADARHTIKSVAGTVAWLNEKGIHVMSQSGPQRLEAFDELFEDGIEVMFSPYDTPNDINGSTSLSSSNGEMEKTFDADMYPWRRYKIDKRRLEKAVAGVWNDLYLVFVSLAGDRDGEDNRLVLCWNWKDNTKSVWLLPDNMGVRGFAYDGTLSTPYVMTRYGLARFEPTHGRDSRYGDLNVTGGSPTYKANVESQEPWAPVVLQTHKFPETGDSFCVSHFSVTHEVTKKSSADDDFKARFQMWGGTAELAMCKVTPDTNMVNSVDVGTLDGLYKGDYNSFLGDFTLDNDSPTQADRSRLAPGLIRRRSAARSGWNALRHQAQVVTLNPGRILGTHIGLTGVAPRGERA